MKMLLAISLAVLGLPALAAPLNAQEVTSIKFMPKDGETPLVAKDVAGVDAVAHWNGDANGDLSFSFSDGPSQVVESASSGLVNSKGAPTRMGYSFTSYGNLSTGGSSVPGANGNMLNGGGMTSGTGGLAPQPVILKLTGLDADHTYKIIVYTSGGPSELTYGSVGLTGGATYYYQSAEGDGVGGALTDLENHSSATNVFGSTPQATAIPSPQALKSNYVEFDGVTGTDGATLTLTELGTWPSGAWAPVPDTDAHAPIGIAAVQVIDTGRKGQAEADETAGSRTRAEGSPVR